MNTKKEETRRFLLFPLILHRYDLREVDGVSCRVFDIYPVASEHAVIEIQRLRAGIAAMRTAVPLSSYTLSP